MLAAIQFNYQHFSWRAKIHNEWTNRMLPPKAYPV
jgi:hypothetical protein